MYTFVDIVVQYTVVDSTVYDSYVREQLLHPMG